MQNSNAPVSPDVPDDRSIIDRIVSGDRGAFEVLMRHYNRRLYRIARAILRDADEAQDALQEAYLSAYRSIGQFRAEATLSTWLSRLVLTESLGRLRRAARRQKVIPMVRSHEGFEMDSSASEDSERPDRVLWREQMRILLERQLDALPEYFRVVFVLRSVEELTVEETAQCLNISEATVRSRHFRAKGLLREALAKEVDLTERDLYRFGGARCDRITAGVLAKLAS